MSLTPSQNGNYPVKKNSIVFYEGQDNKSLNILLQGKVDVFLCPFEKDSLQEDEVVNHSFKIFEIDQNVILGANDLFMSSKHSFSYRSAKDSMVFIFAAQNLDQIKSLIEHQADYAAYLISSIANIINNAYPAYLKIENMSRSLNILKDNLIICYWYLKEKHGFSNSPESSLFSDGLSKLQKLKDNNFAFPLGFNSSFIEMPHFKYNETSSGPKHENLASESEYYKHFVNIPIEARKSFFASDFTVTSHQCQKAALTLNDIRELTIRSLKQADGCMKSMFSEKSDCILKEYIKAAEELKSNSSDISTLVEVISYIIGKLKELVYFFENKYSYKYSVDFEYLDSLLNMLSINSTKASVSNSGSSDAAIQVSEGDDFIPDELKNSAEKILEYSEIPKERADILRINLEAFRNLKDKSSTSEDARAVRNAVSSVFFEIYEAVYKKVMNENNPSRLYNMFLTYAFMDEKLLSTRNTLTLYKNAVSQAAGSRTSVFTMKGWLTEIFNSRRNPSVNEFGQDYSDIFREMKKRGEITDKDKEEYESNVDAKLKHEIFNMFRINHRLCHGQTSVYFPILHEEMITRSLDKAIVTPEIIADRINKILEIDFSAFHREIFYNNPQKGIEKELLMKSIPPDFILMPIYGSRAIMWQEISGRNRNTPGRLILPMFTGENLDDMLIRLIGNFRWELCRTMMGTSWNDITQSSLTADYTDYIQFFKKNKDLSDEAKEKVKAQIQKYNNRLREIFTADYEVWISYESKGIMRLNKVVRSILYKHCPFSREIRSSVEKQPVYSDIAAQFNNLRNKKAKEVENKYNALIRSGITLDPDMEENLKFYKEM